jgi:hypothetical protein
MNLAEAIEAMFQGKVVTNNLGWGYAVKNGVLFVNGNPHLRHTDIDWHKNGWSPATKFNSDTYFTSNRIYKWEVYNRPTFSSITDHVQFTWNNMRMKKIRVSGTQQFYGVEIESGKIYAIADNEVINTNEVSHFKF